MRVRASFLTGLGVLGLCMLVYLYEPAFLTGISHQTYDSLLRLAASPPSGEKVVLIDIDEASLEAVGQWPWPRYILGRLTRRLREAGASVIAFDVAFAERDRFSPSQVEEVWQDALGADFEVRDVPADRKDFDAEFAAGMSEGRVVLGCFVDWLGEAAAEPAPEDDAVYHGHYYEKGVMQRDYLLQAASIVAPVRKLAEAAAGLAFINTTPDLDSVVRRTPLICAHGPDRVYPSLALEAVRLYRGDAPFGIVYDARGTTGVKGLQLRDWIIPTDAHGRLAINFRKGAFPRISAIEFLGGSGALPDLSNAIAIVGTSSAGLHDVKATPLHPELPGFEIQATAVENMLSGDMLKEPRWIFFANLGLMLLLGVVLAFLTSRSSAVVSFLIMIASVTAVVAFSFLALRLWQFIVLPAEFVLSQFAIYVSVTVVDYFLEERARKRVRSMFRTMVSDQVLRYMEEHPESFSLTGSKAMATVFFSDVAGFTTIAEGADPQRVTAFMNRYLTPVTRIIMEHGGFVDKFLGDGVMGVWGVPYSLEETALKDHALQGCLAALAQQEKIGELRPRIEAEFGHVLKVRMGLNSGLVTAGNMGSEDRFSYTVMGETVNLASRFEAANRSYGTSIIIGETTYQRAREEIEARLLDLVVVLGQSHPVHIYELMGRKGRLLGSRLEAAALYEEALRLHWERDWAGAEQKLNAALRASPDDAPSVMLRHRVGNYRLSPPPPEWGGEFVRLRK